jgi:predicted nucleic acid-binding protein
LLLAEPGAEEMRSLWRDADELLSAAVGFVEARSAIARRARGRTRERAREELSDRWAEVAAIDVDEALLRDAAFAADTYRLRALDAVHLAAAWASAEGSSVLASWDEELRRAAIASGLVVAPA